MRLLLALLVLAGAAWGQTPQHRLFEQPNLPHSSLAFFEAFRGAEAACTCSAVTGAKGEALSYSRASTQTCTKTVGVEPQAIANGDLVSCASGQPAVMPGADGTGVAGLLVEGAGTNLITRSEQLENAAWGTNGSAITVTADQAVAPDGTTTADRLQIPAIGALGESTRSGAGTGTGAGVVSIYVKGNGTSGALDLIVGGGAVYGCASCAYTATSWTRCSASKAGGLTFNYIYIGNESVAVVGCPSGTGAKGAHDVFVWGAQSENGTTVPTSYIPTQATTANRVATTASFPIALTTGADFSLAQTFYLADPTAVSNSLISNGVFGPRTFRSTTSSLFRVSDGVINVDSTCAMSSAKWTTGVRLGGTLNRSTFVVTSYVDGVAGTPSAAAPTLSTSSWGSFSLNAPGLHKLLCADQSLPRCR